MEESVSVLIPIYNKADYLGECLDSIVSQTYTDLRIILLDDGSTDGSPQICREYAAKDSRIEFHQTPHNGIAISRRTLRDLARGRYSIYIDSDDYIDRDMIRYMIETIESFSGDFIMVGINGQEFSQQLTFDGDTVILNRQEAIDLFLKGNILSSSLCSKLIKTELLKKLSFPDEIQIGEDTFATWELLRLSDRGIISNRRMYHYRDTPDSLINSDFNEKTVTLLSVWARVIEDCQGISPEYVKYARQHQLDSVVWLLYTALRSNIRRDGRIDRIIEIIKPHLGQYLSTGNLSLKYRAFTICAVRFYTLTRILLTPIRSRLVKLR